MTGAQQVGTTIFGDKIYIKEDALIVELLGTKRVASSSMVNGGCVDGMKYLYNYSYSSSPLVKTKTVAKMQAPNLEVHYQQLTQDLGLPLETTVAMGTAAKLEERAEVTKSFADIKVSAIITAGVDYNGGRAGDPPSYDEFFGENLPAPGTINIMLFIDAQLPCGVLNQAVITATEAKTCALQELQAGSHYSSGLATGSGTDTIMVISNLDARHTLYDAGQHSQLGSLIGQVVKEATKLALSYHGEGMTPQRQGSLQWQGYRYGITPHALSDKFVALYGNKPSPHEVDEVMHSSKVVAYMAPVMHLRDQLEWGIVCIENYATIRDQYLSVFLRVFDDSRMAQALAELLREI